MCLFLLLEDLLLFLLLFNKFANTLLFQLCSIVFEIKIRKYFNLFDTSEGSLSERKKRHSIESMLWMGGEPLLRPDVLEEGIKLFNQNTITTNGTLDLIDLPCDLYVVSIDGSPELNDASTLS